jgi:hypothetical protein
MTYNKQAQALAATGNEIFDLSIPATAQLYQEVKASAKSKVYSRDTTSWDEIIEGVSAVRTAHKGDGIVVLSGAYPHIIGALVKLVRRGDINVNYIPVEGMSISTATKQPHPIIDDEFVSEKDLRVQMERCIGVAKHFGFSDLEEIRAYVNNAPYDHTKPTITFIVLNETGLHLLYSSGKLDLAQDTAMKKLRLIVQQSEQKPNFVFYSGEDASIDGFKDMLSGKGQARTAPQKFLVDSQQDGIPVEIGAFGHRDCAQHDSSFGQRNLGLFGFPERPMIFGRLGCGLIT